MNVQEWSKSTADYSRRLLHSGREGAAHGRESFLHGTGLVSFFRKSARTALKPAALGACLGVLSGHPVGRHHSVRRTFACGFLGYALGFGAGVLWQTRRLAASVASGAWRDISRARDEHWLERNPINYA